MDDDLTNDPQRLALWLTNRSEGLVVFDGPAGAGKTILMREIAKRLHKSRVIDVDDFLERGRGVFVDAIRFDELRGELCNALENDRFVFIASLCARKVVDLLELTKAAFVYVIPHDEPHFSEAIAEEYGETASHDPLGREIEEYHKEYRPFRNADVRYILNLTETRKAGADEGGHPGGYHH